VRANNGGAAGGPGRRQMELREEAGPSGQTQDVASPARVSGGVVRPLQNEAHRLSAGDMAWPG